MDLTSDGVLYVSLFGLKIIYARSYRGKVYPKSSMHEKNLVSLIFGIPLLRAATECDKSWPASLPVADLFE